MIRAIIVKNIGKDNSLVDLFNQSEYPIDMCSNSVSRRLDEISSDSTTYST